MIWNISWRNVWRNRLRSMVVVSAIALGLACTIFSIAFMNGVGDQAVRSTIATETSDIQLHHPLFMQNEEIQYTLDHADSLMNELRRKPEVLALCRRTKVIAMASTAATGTGVIVNGIFPDEEIKVTDLYKQLLSGSYFTGGKRNPVIIGAKLATKLKVKLHSKIVLTLQTRDGVLTGGAFRVIGIFKTENSSFDESSIFVQNSDLVRLINFPADQAHEIAVRLVDSNKSRAVMASWIGEFPHLDIESWRELRPDIGFLQGSMKQMMNLFLVVIMAAMAFGIINTMLMAVVERVRELGMLMALGMSKIRIFTMILLETVFLSLCGGILGMGIGGAAVLYFGITGINLAGLAQGLSALGYSTMVFPHIGAVFFFVTALMIILTAILSSLYPARKALKFKPAQAIRME